MLIKTNKISPWVIVIDTNNMLFNYQSTCHHECESCHGKERSTIIYECEICRKKVCNDCYHLGLCQDHYNGLSKENKATLDGLKKEFRKNYRIANLIFNVFLIVDFILIIAYIIYGFTQLTHVDHHELRFTPNGLFMVISLLILVILISTFFFVSHTLHEKSIEKSNLNKLYEFYKKIDVGDKIDV
ncbi:MAG: hypothetical protein JW891_04320 [Candidatus Lokiarchaeota archaeon]|nr:hypothetical protein [Candidatus Lokiarchaeota archaeon]